MVGTTASQEYFADYSPLTSTHFTLNCLPTPLSPYVPSLYVVQQSK